MKITLLFAISAGFLTACSPDRPAAAQTPVVWMIAPLHGALKPGATANLRIEARIEDGWHIYSITQPAGGPVATRITFPTGQTFESAGNPKPSVQPGVAYDEAFHMNVELYEKAASFTVPVRRAGATITAPDSVHVNVRYQVCNASLCFPPHTAKLAAPVLGTVE